MSINPSPTEQLKQDAKREAKQISWAPQPGPQYAYFETSVTELLYGGAAGGGKSDALLFDAIGLCMQYEKYRAILFRRTFPELQDSLVPRINNILYGYAKPTEKGMRWIFPNGSTLRLSHMQREEDKEKHKSTEYDFIGFDELTSFTESQYTYLFSRCRGARDVPRFVRSASNPTGVGHAWVKKRFVEPDPDLVERIGYKTYDYAYGWEVNGQIYTSFEDLPKNFHKGSPAFSEERYPVYKERKSGVTRAYIPALLWANEMLIKNDPDYVNKIRALPEKQVKALLYGSWDVFEGQFFPAFNPEVHVIKPFTLPEHFERFVGIDYGYTDPFAALWGAVGPDGSLYIYKEAYEKQLTPQDQAEMILSMSRDEKVEWFAADPSMFNRGTGYGESKADIYTRHGLDLIPANRDRQAGWALLHEYLEHKRIFFFETCENIIRTIPLMVHDKNKPEDFNTRDEDHALDALRYLLITLKGSHPNDIREGHVEGSHDNPPDWWYNKVKPNLKQRKAFKYGYP